MKLLLLTLLIASCSKGNKPKGEAIGLLNKRASLYCELSKPYYLANKKVEGSTCDGALFTALHGMACDYVDISQFEKDGLLYRTPTKDCKNPKFSKDMALGLQLFIAKAPTRYKDLIDRVIEYGNSHKWQVCTSPDHLDSISRCLMSPKIVSRWENLRSLARGSKVSEINSLSSVVNTDFRAHLDIISIAAEAKMYGSISNKSLDIVAKQAEREPKNLLFQAMYAAFISGKRTEVAVKLLDAWPKDRLPTSADWCTHYLYQRDYLRNGKPNADWLPCPEKTERHPATEFLLASWVLTL